MDAKQAADFLRISESEFKRMRRGCRALLRQPRPDIPGYPPVQAVVVSRTPNHVAYPRVMVGFVCYTVCIDVTNYMEQTRNDHQGP